MSRGNLDEFSLKRTFCPFKRGGGGVNTLFCQTYTTLKQFNLCHIQIILTVVLRKKLLDIYKNVYTCILIDFESVRAGLDAVGQLTVRSAVSVQRVDVTDRMVRTSVFQNRKP